ncbi:MAG: hypothetical protein H7A23_20540 [Leptospiraceae bacterium]|nr:hypothetical protein [Leptospiraceae bacterium]
MLIFSLIFGFVFLFLVWVLFTPIIVYINSANQTYFIKLKGVFKLQIVWIEDKPDIRLTVFFITCPIPKKSKNKDKQKKKEKRKEKKGKKLSPKTITKIKRFIIESIKSFSVIKIKILIDTDDYALNSKLYPLAHSLNTENIQIGINYNGTNEFCIVVKNRIITFIIIALKNIIK